uniref:Uncharacterized protein n=1 Tax=Arundo donax TaxID=35708 RepID=A0A0A9G9H6_ARUDO
MFSVVSDFQFKSQFSAYHFTLYGSRLTNVELVFCQRRISSYHLDMHRVI